jgi:putative tryptophan/tyrosine transport system substrate-binding protein
VDRTNRNSQRNVMWRWAGFLVAVLISTACATPASAQKGKVHRVAFIAVLAPVSALKGADPINPAARSFVHGLRDLGYVEGRHLVLDFRSLEGRYERAPEILADIVRSRPDVIVTASQVIVERYLAATSGIPVVTLASWSLIETGVVKSLSRPGGTVTGFIVDVDARAEAKRVELIRDAIPSIKRMAFLGVSASWESPATREILLAAERLGMSIVYAPYTGADVQGAAGIIEREAPDAIFVPAGSSSFANRQRIGEFASARRIPCIAPFKEIAEHGCLMSYGVDVNELMRAVAGYVAKILAGAKPADMPIQQPTKFELVINMKQAKALGLTIPQPLLLRADRIIE